MTDSDKANVLTQILITYTAQLEEMDRFSSNFLISVLSIATAIVAAIFALSGNNNDLNHLFSFIYLIIPCFCMAILYYFALMNRRVAIYRGSCAAIEKELLKITGSNRINLHGELFTKYYNTNGVVKSGAKLIGPGFEALFLIMLLCICFIEAYKLGGESTGFKVIWIIILVSSVSVCYFCGKDILGNDAILEEIKNLE